MSPTPTYLSVRFPTERALPFGTDWNLAELLETPGQLFISETSNTRGSFTSGRVSGLPHHLKNLRLTRLLLFLIKTSLIKKKKLSSGLGVLAGDLGEWSGEAVGKFCSGSWVATWGEPLVSYRAKVHEVGLGCDSAIAVDIIGLVKCHPSPAAEAGKDGACR